MKGPAVDQIVFDFMFPKPKSTDPQNFQGLLQRQLVPEVRLETQAFYGHLSSQEAKYPGLDYSYQPHRVRLSRYPWHRRLFRAFDAIGLTSHEIATLTKWEGTRWAKERFEREQGILIRDTTADGIADWLPPHLRAPVDPQAHRADVEDMEDVQDDDETEDNEIENEMDEDVDDSDNEMVSVGVALNEQLRANAALREAGSDTVMDEAWEQWLKDAAESGGIPYMPAELSPNANVPGTRPAVETALPSRLLIAARMGQWSQIPESIQTVVRQHIADNHRRREDAQVGPSTSTHGMTRSANPLSVSRPPAPTSSTSSPFSRAAPPHPSSMSAPPFLSRSSLNPRPRILPAAMMPSRADSRSLGRFRATMDPASSSSIITYVAQGSEPRTTS